MHCVLSSSDERPTSFNRSAKVLLTSDRRVRNASAFSFLVINSSARKYKAFRRLYRTVIVLDSMTNFQIEIVKFYQDKAPARRGTGRKFNNSVSHDATQTHQT